MTDEATILSALKGAKPRALRINTADREDAVLVQISQKRDKWRRALDTLEQLEWTRIEMLGDGDAIIGILTEDSDALEGTEVAIAANASTEERIASMLIQAQKLALDHQAAMLQPLIQGYVSLNEIMANRLGGLEANYAKVLQAAYDQAAIVAQLENQAGDGLPPGMGELMAEFLQARKAKKQLKTAGETE